MLENIELKYFIINLYDLYNRTESSFDFMLLDKFDVTSFLAY